MPTLRDVAQLAGVSTATVSHVVNNSRRISPETRERVERAIAETGFVPNAFGQMLAKRRNETRAAKKNQTVATDSGAETFADGSDHQISPKTTPNTHPRTVAPTDASKFILRRIHLDNDDAARVSGGTTRFLLKLIRAAQPISRAELARRLNVNRSTVTEIVRPLLDFGVLREDARQPSMIVRAGRPPIGLSLCSDRVYFIGINLGVRNSQVGVMTIDNQMLTEESFDTPSDATQTLERIRGAIERASIYIPADVKVFIGISVPSPVDANRTRILYAPHLDWRDTEVAEGIRPSADKVKENIFNAPITVENDAMAAAIYETRRRLRDTTDDSWDDFILVRAGTGIGVGLVLGGDAYRGTGIHGGIVGEFGHMTIVAGGKPCACGNRGCWERYASATSAVSLYTGDRLAQGTTTVKFVDIVARAEAGERRAQATLEQVGEYLGIGISNVITGLGIRRVVVSGRVAYGWEFIKEPLRAAVARTMAGRLMNWSVEAGEPHGSGLGGGLEVAVEHYLSSLTDQTQAA
ncbi:MAG: xylose repressor [Pyrinomonadaceae bacterium]